MKRRGIYRAQWTPETIELFKACWQKHQRQIARIVAREMRVTPDAAERAYYRFIVAGEPSRLGHADTKDRT